MGKSIHEMRAVHVTDFVHEYARKQGLSITEDGLATVLGDLIADLMHLYAREGDENSGPEDALEAVGRGVTNFAAASRVAPENAEFDIGPDVDVVINVESEDFTWESNRSGVSVIDNSKIAFEG